ncbi:hypothetical protein QTN24_23350 [Cupriavidus sp. SZY C1]|uniref:hypothetical protein n=1 Tax=Cupriavidus sp. SZY C1 TaxID=3055037 RepID=UPI0028B34990|nr:hypothetical protein [Cupriavidus sp. SZY C1]MDT6964454.1 hypothetical protein [Cupriavidus sp. SZY C1]
MKAIIIAGMFLVLSSTALAQRPVHSCAGDLSVEGNRNKLLILREDSRKIATAKSKHQLDGGLFNLDNSLLVVYGLPNQVDRIHPQTTRLTVFSIEKGKPRMRRIFGETFGSGILEIGFTQDNKSIYVSTRLGHGLIDIRNKDVAWFSLSEELDVKLQECPPDNATKAF